MTMMPSSIRSSTHLLWFPASSAMVPRLLRSKIATAVEAGLLGYNMYIRGNQFRAGDGIVAKGVENSLKNVGRLGKQGMKETNNEIIAIMVGC